MTLLVFLKLIGGPTMLKDTQQIVDILDKEIKDAEKACRDCKKGPSHADTIKTTWYFKGLLRAQKIFLENIHLPF